MLLADAQLLRKRCLTEIDGKNEVKFAPGSKKDDIKAFVLLSKQTVFELYQAFPTQIDGTFKKYYEVAKSHLELRKERR